MLYILNELASMRGLCRLAKERLFSSPSKASKIIIQVFYYIKINGYINIYIYIIIAHNSIKPTRCVSIMYIIYT